MLNNKILLSLVVVCAFSNLKADGEDWKEEVDLKASRQAEKQKKIEETKKDLESLMNELRPVRDRMYTYHYDKIKWLGKNYTTDKEQGDRIINDLTNDAKPELNKLALMNCEKSAKAAKINPAQWEMDECQDIAQQVLITMVVLGMKDDAEARSKAYQERKARTVKVEVS